MRAKRWDPSPKRKRSLLVRSLQSHKCRCTLVHPMEVRLGFELDHQLPEIQDLALAHSCLAGQQHYVKAAGLQFFASLQSPEMV